MNKQHAALCALMALAFTAGAQTLTIKNTVGSDAEDFSDYDLFSGTKETDISGSTVKENIIALGDRFQLDFETNTLFARIRMDLLYSNSYYDDLPSFIIAPSGFVHYAPVSQIGFALGTNFNKYFAIPSAYMAAADDTTKYGRLLTDSLGYDVYVPSDNENFGLYTNGFSGGITSDWFFGDKSSFYLKSAVGSTVYTDFSETTEASLDAGINFGAKTLFDTGFTAHNITSDYRKFGAFAGLKSVKNLTLNTGFYYNFTDSDYLPEARVSRKDDDGNAVDKFKKQSTKYAFALTGGYKFKDAGISLYADFLTGLTDQYIGEVKYYDNDGNLVKTEVKTITRGVTIVKYRQNSSGVYKAKRTDEYTANAVPLYAQVRADYKVNDSLKLGANVKLRTMIRDSSQTWITVYPKLNIKLPDDHGSIGAGLKFDSNLTRCNGISSVSIPFTYTYKFKQEL